MLEGKLTLKLQLILAVTVPCLALLLVGGASLKSMGTIQQQSTELYRTPPPPCGPWRRWSRAFPACGSAST
ncbi:hypothetical protein H2136_02890 [Aeromonas hydrophila]|uniref:Uncharacterized protein n=1 Tax=Aeromonas hydrophila TaxID=644 RepID=A0A926IXW9_AERHY|nr:hypothetical protein [Aeromonas hydrophila]